MFQSMRCGSAYSGRAGRSRGVEAAEYIHQSKAPNSARTCLRNNQPCGICGAVGSTDIALWIHVSSDG